MQTNRTNIEVVRSSVMEQDVDAIVNAANTVMRGGGGVDGAVQRAAGKGLMEELMLAASHGAKTGTAVITGEHNFTQKHILHTPGPVWNGGKSKAAQFASPYRFYLGQ